MGWPWCKLVYMQIMLQSINIQNISSFDLFLSTEQRLFLLWLQRYRFQKKPSFPFLMQYMIQVFLCPLSYASNIRCRCTIDFIDLLHKNLSHIFLVVVPSFSMFCHLRFVPSVLSSKICSCIQSLHDQIYYK